MNPQSALRLRSGSSTFRNPQSMVYVVDDDPSVRKGLSRLLRSAGFKVEVFSSARAFLDRPQPGLPQSAIRNPQSAIPNPQSQIPNWFPA